jgi:hypothetical protein
MSSDLPGFGVRQQYPLRRKDMIFILHSPKNTPSIAEGLDGDEFGIVGEEPTINCSYKACPYALISLRDCPKGFQI